MYFTPKRSQVGGGIRWGTSAVAIDDENWKREQHSRKEKIRCAVERVALSEPTTSPGHATATPPPSAPSIWTGNLSPCLLKCWLVVWYNFEFHFRYRPSYNASPGSNLAVVRRDDAASGAGASGGDGYAIHCMKWGLIPGFTKKSEKPDFYKMVCIYVCVLWFFVFNYYTVVINY